MTEWEIMSFEKNEKFLLGVSVLNYNGVRYFGIIFYLCGIDIFIRKKNKSEVKQNDRTTK